MAKHITIPAERIEKAILLARGHKVLLDADLARLYGVTTFNLNKAVKRNINRFPEDFMFRLSKQEAALLRFQTGISKTSGRGGRRYLPYVFTEQGVAMLREMLATHKDLARKLEELEKKYDAQFQVVFEAIRQLMAPIPQPEKTRRIGFGAP